MINLLSNKEGQIKNNTLEINLDSQNSENYNLDFKSVPCDNLIINLSNYFSNKNEQNRCFTHFFHLSLVKV